MPTYDYVCTSCSHEFEAFQSMNDKPLTTCPACKESTVKRRIGGGAGLIFKGSGFYITDYKNKSSGSSDSSGKSSGNASSSGGTSSAAPAASAPSPK